MSAELCRKAIARFLITDGAETLCLRGKWGTGKTHAWNEVLAANRDSIPLKSYSYISLFGLDNLDAVKSAIFENSIDTASIGIIPSLESFKTNTIGIAKQLGLKYTHVFKRLPGASDFAASFDAISFLSVRNKVICFDDLERKGENLKVRQILGLASFLKEHRNCKVALILNDGELSSEEKDFKKYLEKVVDASVLFEPAAEEAAKIALKGEDNAQKKLRECVVALDISNIRVIKQVERLVTTLKPQLQPFNTKILQQAIQTLTLLAWCNLPENAGAFDYITKKRGSFSNLISGENNASEIEKSWANVLDMYGFGTIDEFDYVLSSGMGRGYFDETKIKEFATELDTQFKSAEKEGTFTAAWRLYHNTFDSNEDELVSALEKSFEQAYNEISPTNVDGTVRLLKELGHTDVARRCLKLYLDARANDRNLFDLKNSPFGDRVIDPQVREAFDRQFAAYEDTRDPASVLLDIARKSGWNSEDIVLLNKLTENDFYDIFKKAGENADRIIGTCLRYGDLPDFKNIRTRAIEALKKIGNENKLNQRRVEKFGIKLDE